MLCTEFFVESLALSALCYGNVPLSWLHRGDMIDDSKNH